MIPFILSVIGGYLIGDSMKSSTFADGGRTTVVDVIDSSKGRSEYELYEMVVMSLENESTYVDRFLVSARNINEAKQIATDLWEKDAEPDAVITGVMSEDRYRMFYLNK
jgi:hypothetical protein